MVTEATSTLTHRKGRKKTNGHKAAAEVPEPASPDTVKEEKALGLQEAPPPADAAAAATAAGSDRAVLRAIRFLLRAAQLAAQLACLAYFLWRAYKIRLFAVKEYGRVIHEFDPWFNMRATQYLADNGWYKFFHWFDYMSWYPLGRPVGTTIYPGMQIISVWIWEALKFVPAYQFRVKKAIPLDPIPYNVTVWPEFRGKYETGPMSLNDVCCMVPAWFGALGSLFLGLLTSEVTRSRSAGVAAAGVMAIIPAHFSRGIAGGFDNESVAVTALCMTFWLWCRALRTRASWPYGALAGAAYIYMAAAWGGFIFVNMVAAHAALLVALGRYNSSLYKAYSLFFVIGTFGATRVPVIGMTPFKSMEQIGALLVFAVFQVLEGCDWYRRRQAKPMPGWKFCIFRVTVFAVLLGGAAVACQVLSDMGYFSPLGARIRGLFIQHKKTGNPLVDSVAEHQAASNSAYWGYLHNACYVAPIGLIPCLVNRTPAKWFLVLFAIVAYYFSLKMARLIIICGPIASALSGAAIGMFVDACCDQIVGLFDYRAAAAAAEEEEPPRTGGISTMWRAVFYLPALLGRCLAPAGRALSWVAATVPGKLARAAVGASLLAVFFLGHRKGDHHAYLTQLRGFVPPAIDVVRIPDKVPIPFTKGLPKSVDLPVLGRTRVPKSVEIPLGGRYKIGGKNAPRIRGSDGFWPANALKTFADYCEQMAQGMSSPQIMFKSQTGEIIDDYREAYFWLRDKTPTDARVMAWWDYGYQITGIGNRTTIADGNTWNHEHIATLGKCLTSSEDRAHAMVRHLADYVLIWGGGRGDDLAKSIHMARIGTSIYSDICGLDDPTCAKFGFDHRTGQPTPMMSKSLLYKLHSHGQQGVIANPKLWKEAYQSQHGLVRIFQVLRVDEESKKWIADPENRVCDAPGSWYCRGQYPPKLLKHMKNRKDFAQLEDFNKKGQEKSAYTKAVEKGADV